MLGVHSSIVNEAIKTNTNFFKKRFWFKEKTLNKKFSPLMKFCAPKIVAFVVSYSLVFFC